MGRAFPVLAAAVKARPAAENVSYRHGEVYQLVYSLSATEEGGGAEMNNKDMERKFLLRMKELSAAGGAVYLAMSATLHAMAELPVNPPEGYTRMDFKRAIRVIRECQVAAPDLSEEFEKGAALIRRDWLHREDVKG